MAAIFLAVPFHFRKSRESTFVQRERGGEQLGYARAARARARAPRFANHCQTQSGPAALLPRYRMQYVRDFSISPMT